jgi:ribosomal-protein-alanine N-acetyltransferase
MKLEPLRLRDIDELLSIEEDLFGAERWTADMFRGELQHGYHYLVARDDDGAIAGYAGLAIFPPDEAWVNNIAVRRDAQRQGIGRVLLEALLTEAARHKARRVLLEVAVDNGPAQKLYAGYGFETISVRRRYYQPSNTDALVMMREQ